MLRLRILQSGAPMVLFFILLFREPVTGLKAAVRYERSLTAVKGQNVTLQCEFLLPFEVLQLTWQRIKGSSSENVATYSKKYGAKVLGSFKRRVYLADTQPNRTSINLKEVTLEDEACYSCLFSTYPHGSYMGITCLQVHTLFEVGTQYFSDQSTHGFITANCTATGKPAPEIIYKPETVLISQSQEQRVRNADGTVTVTRTCNYSAESLQSQAAVILKCVITHPVQSQELAVYQYQESEALTEGRRNLWWTAGLLFLIVLMCIILRFGRMKPGKSESPSISQVSEEKIQIETQHGGAPSNLTEGEVLLYHTPRKDMQKTPCKTSFCRGNSDVGSPGTAMKQRKTNLTTMNDKKIVKCLIPSVAANESFPEDFQQI